MTTKIEKFLRKLSPRMKAKVRDRILKVNLGQFTEVDFKKLKNCGDLYRLRVDWIRIILKKTDGNFEIVDVAARKDVYKRLRF